MFDNPTSSAAPMDTAFKPSIYEIENDTRYRRQMSIDFALRAAGGPIVGRELIENAKLIEAYIAGPATTNT